MRYALYNLWMTAHILEAMGGIFAAWCLITLRQRFGYYMAGVVVCVAIESFVAATSLFVFGTDGVKLSIGFMLARTFGRLLKGASLWLLVLYCLGYVNGAYGKGAE